jgi:hypothetical protein
MTTRGTVHNGQIFLWRYLENARNYPGYNLTADKTGCECLLSTLSKLKQATKSIKVVVSLCQVTPMVLSVPNNKKGKAACISFLSLELSTHPELKPKWMRFKEIDQKCSLELSSSQVGCIVDGIEDIQNGKGDYCIGEIDGQELWFWWFTGV